MQEIQWVRFFIGRLNFEAKRFEKERIRELKLSYLTNRFNDAALHVNRALHSLFVLLLCKSPAIPFILEVHFRQLRL